MFVKRHFLLIHIFDKKKHKFISDTSDLVVKNRYVEDKNN